MRNAVAVEDPLNRAGGQLDVTEVAHVNRELLLVLGLEGRFAPHVLDLADGQPVVMGDLFADPMRVPPVEDELVDDLVLPVCKRR